MSTLSYVNGRDPLQSFRWRGGEMVPVEIRCDLKVPCADCPFRRSVDLHIGILANLESALALAEGQKGHTCHRTDPDSDSPAGRRHRGSMQHCAGLLVMRSRVEDQDIDIPPCDDVMGFGELVSVYGDWIEVLQARRELWSNGHLEPRCLDCGCRVVWRREIEFGPRCHDCDFDALRGAAR